MNGAREAYDALAIAYDGLFVNAGRGPWEEAYTPFLGNGVRLLDAGCGTGADLARAVRGGCVATGTDLSPGMLGVARENLLRQALEANLVCADLGDLGDTFPPASFDVIVSGFAALNTAGDPSRFAKASAGVLAPAGMLLLHFLTPGGLYDRAGHLTRGRFAEALGGWGGTVRSVQVGDHAVEHQLYNPVSLYRTHFERHFECLRVGQVGLLTPDDGPSRMPRALAGALGQVEAAVRWTPGLGGLGRFGILVLRKR